MLSQSQKLISSMCECVLKCAFLLNNMHVHLGRNQMSNVDVKVSSGQLDVSKEKNLLVWGLGRQCAPGK